MKIRGDEEKIGKSTIQFLTPTSTSLGIDLSIYLLEIVIKIGRHFPIILLSSASVNILLAANDLLSNSLVFATINLGFALGNFIFLAQLYQRKKIQPDDSNHDLIESSGELNRN